MSVITDYLKDLNSFIDEIPFKLSAKIQADNRGDVALYVKSEILFSDRSELLFKEYLVAIPILKRLTYSYQYQDRSKELIFRFDNAEHHREVSTYPHHKHIKNMVLSSKEMSLKEIINEIINLKSK